jgi:hypothetical protein
VVGGYADGLLKEALLVEPDLSGNYYEHGATVAWGAG